MKNWTREPPTKPGRYWHKAADAPGYPDDPHVRTFLVYEWLGTLCVNVLEEEKPLSDYQTKLVGAMGGLWQGASRSPMA
jgi:hypothetical protein